MSTNTNNSNKQNDQFLDDIYADIKQKQRRRSRRTIVVISLIAIAALVAGCALGWKFGTYLQNGVF